MLKEVQLITAAAWLHPLILFGNLQSLEVDLEIVRLEDDAMWPHLEDLRLRGNLDISKLESFVARHKQLRHLHLAVVSCLRPLGPEPGQIDEMLRLALRTGLNSDLVSSIMEHVTEHASGHERSLFQHLYTRLDELTKEKAEELRKSIINAYETMMEFELDMYCEELGKMKVPSASASQLELSMSGEVFWEDQLAIKGMTSTVRSKDGQWINEEIDEMSSVSYTFTNRTTTRTR